MYVFIIIIYNIFQYSSFAEIGSPNTQLQFFVLFYVIYYKNEHPLCMYLISNFSAIGTCVATCILQFNCEF